MLFRPWLRRFTKVISASLLQISIKFSGKEFEEIQRYIGSPEIPKLLRVPPSTS